MRSSLKYSAVLVLFASLLASAVGCGEDDSSDDSDDDGHGGEGHDHGTVGPSGAECPEGSDLTYATFGENFFQSYCTACHSSSLSGVDRNDAPDGIDFDSLDAARAVGSVLIDLHAAAGPDHVNTVMPPEDHEPHPSEAERRELGEWLACGMN